MKYMIQIIASRYRKAYAERRYAAGYQPPPVIVWMNAQDLILEFDRVADADKCLAQIVSGSKGSNPRRKYPNNVVDVRAAEDLDGVTRHYSNWAAWVGDWVIVLEAYKTYDNHALHLETTVPLKILHRFQTGRHGGPQVGGDNYLPDPAPEVASLAAAKCGRFFSLCALSRLG